MDGVHAAATAGTDSAERDALHAARAHAYENSRPEVRRHVPAGARRILDVGCASGAVGEALKAEGAVEVVGIEVDPVYAERAATRLDRVIRADVEELVSQPAMLDEIGTFDCLLAGDVLEHLRDPWTVLGSLARLLDPGGTAVVSLPNIRHWQTFWYLGVKGSWPRHGEGIFDRDHLRWFTVADGIALLEGAGLQAQVVERMYRLRRTISPRDHIARRLGRTPLRPFFTFQFVIVGRSTRPRGRA